MKRMKIFAATLALGAAILVGTAGAALAFPGYHGGGQAMNQEQQAAVRKEYAEHYNATAPLHREVMAKRAELQAMSYNKNVDNGKVQSLYREIADIEARLFTANAVFEKKLADQGIPYAGQGMGYGGHRGGHRGGYMGQGHGMRGGHGGGCRW